MRQCWRRKAEQRPDFIEIVKRLRMVLQSQKLLTGQDRIVSTLDGIDSPKNSINLEEKSPDSVLSKQYDMDDKVTQRLVETTEETSTILRRGEDRASDPTLEKYKQSMEMKEEKSSVIRSISSNKVRKWHRRSSLPSPLLHRTSSGETSKKHFRKWIKPLASSRHARLNRYKNRSKQTKDKS
uniref:PK_Tyr_Ser-Thr domain-containing protein n=1 Tax=Elaeophora elaphi TaxID=1147741 RepID=A0A0R3S2G3_9BILA